MATPHWFSDHKRTIDYCTFCPKMCRFACPVAEAEKSETVTPTAKMTNIYLLRSGAVKLNEETASLFYKCSDCLACRTYCRHEIEQPKTYRAARDWAVAEGVEIGGLKALHRNYEKRGNCAGADEIAIKKALKGALRTDNKAKTAILPGTAAVTARTGLARDAMALCDWVELPANVVYEDGLVDAGYDLAMAGYGKDFRSHLGKLKKALSGYKTVVCLDPRDAHALTYLAQEVRAEPRIEVLDFVSFALKYGPRWPQARKTRKYIYLDDDHLGYKGDYDGARKLLAQINGGAPREFFNNREEARTAGAGGVYRLTDPDGARMIARDRWEEFDRGGADALVTASPMAAALLDEHAEGREVLDLISVMAKALK